MKEILDKNSSACGSGLLDLFSVPQTQVQIDSSFYQPIYATSAVKPDGPFGFIVPASPHYFHMKHNFLLITLKLTKADQTKATAGDCAPIQLIAKTLFRQCKVIVNGKVAFDSGPLLAYRAYLETELNYDNEAKKSFLQSQLYIKDEPHDNVNTFSANTGFAKRAALFQDSVEVQLMAPVTCDLFNCDRLLLANTPLQLELYKNSHEFCLLTAATESYRLQVVDIVWYIKMIEVSPSCHLAVEACLHKIPARYPIKRMECVTLGISGGRFSAPTTPLWTGQIPRRIVVGIVETSAFFGDYRKSPFVFANHGLKEICIEAAGKNYPRHPLQCDFAKKHYVNAFVQLYESLGLDGSRTNGIQYDEFATTHCLFVFDLSPDEADSASWQLIKSGATVLRASFSTAVPSEGLQVDAIGEFDSCILVDSARNIHADYSI
jgi:ribonucleoside-diphosphate reductase beta chain